MSSKTTIEKPLVSVTLKRGGVQEREAEVSVYTYYDYPNKLITKLTSLHEDSVSRYRMNIKKKMGVDNVNEMKKKLTLLFNENIDFKTPENTDPKPKTNK